MHEEWLTTQQAADLSGYHINYIRNLLQWGKIEGRKWGQAWQVSRKSLMEYIREGQKEDDKRRGPQPKQR